MSEKRIEPMDDSTRSYVAVEVDHDLKEDFDSGMDRIRWNNRAMAMVLARLTKYEAENESLRKLVKEAFIEGFDRGENTVYSNDEESWDWSDAKKQLEGECPPGETDSGR